MATATRVGSTRTQRLRKAHCHECEYIIYLSRKAIGLGLPACPVCGDMLACADPADAVNAGVLDLDHLPRVERTAICRANGWEDQIIRTAPPRRSAPKQCASKGCSVFVKRGERYCGSHADQDMAF